MAPEELMAGLSALSERRWMQSPRSGEPGCTRWAPVVEISATGIWLGLDRMGSWVLG
ncbi:hypothetical protein ACIQXD_37090 [Streptomyces uncialis]|uniref:hypothetical protein n=1 Tax=Streptomyces uncialis TaxID=1048205 RepID=UPI003812BECB